MIDDEYKVWLLECNATPSLSESNPFLSTLLHRMIGPLLLILDDLFKVTVDKSFPVKDLSAESQYRLLDYPNDELLW